jgi:hypothetical protein
MAVVAPMPNASINTVVAVKPGDFNKWRTVILKLRNGIITSSIWNASFDPQSDRGTCIGSILAVRRCAHPPLCVSTAVEERPFQGRVSGPNI